MILFSDFDRTIFFHDDAERMKRNLDAIKKWRAAGNLCFVVSGRSLVSLKDVFPGCIEYFDGFILDNGSSIYDKNQNLLSSFPFTDEKIAEIFSTVEKNTKEFPKVVYSTIESEGFERPKDPTKIRLWFEELEETKKLFKIVEPINSNIYLVKQTKEPSYHKELQKFAAFLELTPEESGKNNAIKKVIEDNHFNLSEVICVGDSENDREMLEDFDGYMISESTLNDNGANFKKIDSVADLIEKEMERK